MKPKNEGMGDKVKILLRSSTDKNNASSISLELKHNFLENKYFQCFERHTFCSLLPEYNSKSGKSVSVFFVVVVFLFFITLQGSLY